MDGSYMSIMDKAGNMKPLKKHTRNLEKISEHILKTATIRKNGRKGENLIQNIRRDKMTPRGGKREGAGRPKGTGKPATRKRVNMWLPFFVIEWLKQQPFSQAKLVVEALVNHFNIKRG